jgi:hypothetical protein
MWRRMQLDSRKSILNACGEIPTSDIYGCISGINDFDVLERIRTGFRGVVTDFIDYDLSIEAQRKEQP